MVDTTHSHIRRSNEESKGNNEDNSHNDKGCTDSGSSALVCNRSLRQRFLPSIKEARQHISIEVHKP